jgi:hypothetical protein
MNPNPIANDARRARRARRLPADARCLLCGQDNPVVLSPAKGKLPDSVLEEHHIVGWRIDEDLTAVVCANCHLLNHELLRTAGVDLKRPSKNLLEQLLTWLTAISAFLRALADSAHALAVRLRTLIATLDNHQPTWRNLPEISA